MNGDYLHKIPDNLVKLESFLKRKEEQYELKKGTKAKILWHEGEPAITEYSVVYLHGFRASHPEGEPVHRKIAEKLGVNLYLSRLEEHGITTEKPLLYLTEKKLLQSAHFACEIGKRIGEKVILMGTSTGGSLSLYLASHPTYRQYISALVLYSPLIDFYNYHEKLLRFAPLRIGLKAMLGKDYDIPTIQASPAEDRIWFSHYALQGALALGRFVEHQMTNECFTNVTCPVFVGYYFKNEQEQDKVVSVKAIKKMVTQLGTRTEMVWPVSFPEAKSHVISSSLTSPTTKQVIYKSYDFLKNIV